MSRSRAPGSRCRRMWCARMRTDGGYCGAWSRSRSWSITGLRGYPDQHQLSRPGRIRRPCESARPSRQARGPPCQPPTRGRLMTTTPSSLGGARRVDVYTLPARPAADPLHLQFGMGHHTIQTQPGGGPIFPAGLVDDRRITDVDRGAGRSGRRQALTAERPERPDNGNLAYILSISTRKMGICVPISTDYRAGRSPRPQAEASPRHAPRFRLAGRLAGHRRPTMPLTDSARAGAS